MTGFNPGDIVVDFCEIGGAEGGTVDISRRIAEFRIYESIQKPYTSITMTVMDNSDILNKNVDLNGTNSLTISFHQPGQRPYVGTWQVFTVEKSRDLDNQRTAIYQITGYSEHMNNLPKVQKSYQGMSATDVASDLINNFLSIAKPLIVNAPAKGILGNQMMPYLINGTQIFKAIHATLLRGASTVDQSSAYLLFENQFNMVIDTLEHLLNQAVANPVATYYQRPLGMDFLRDVALQPFIILSYKEDTRKDQSQQVSSQSQETRTFDLFSHGFEAVQHAFGGAGGKAASYNNHGYNIMRPPTFMKDVLAARKYVASTFDSQAVTIHVSFNSDLTAGGGFAAELLAPAGDTSTPVLDDISGPFLIAEVCHTVNLRQVRMQGTSTCRGVRGNLDAGGGINE